MANEKIHFSYEIIGSVICRECGVKMSGIEEIGAMPVEQKTLAVLVRISRQLEESNKQQRRTAIATEKIAKAMSRKAGGK